MLAHALLVLGFERQAHQLVSTYLSKRKGIATRKRSPEDEQALGGCHGAEYPLRCRALLRRLSKVARKDNDCSYSAEQDLCSRVEMDDAFLSANDVEEFFGDASSDAALDARRKAPRRVHGRDGRGARGEGHAP